MKRHLQLNGRITVSVIGGREPGRIIHQSNLILNRGMNLIATKSIPEMFEKCVKGTGTTDTKETISGTYSRSANVVTRASGSRDFTSGDVGNIIKFSGGSIGIITALNAVDSVNTSTSGTITTETIIIYRVTQNAMAAESARTNTYSAVSGENSTSDASNVRTLKRTFVFDPETGAGESVTGTYSKASNVVTRLTGARDFTADDVDDFISFSPSGKEYKITAFNDVDEIEVDDSADTITANTITLYGSNTYTEIGFSDVGTAGANINIRIKLDTPVVAYKPTSIYPGQQVKVQYQLAITVTPNASTPGTLPIHDPANLMSINKDGDYVIEKIALGKVAGDGSTDIADAALEPSIAGLAVVSPSAIALSPLAVVPGRITGAFYKQAELQAYTTDSYQIGSLATLNTNDAISSTLKSFGISSDEASGFAFCFLTDYPQTKSGTMSISMHFTKSWSRVLN